MHNPAIAGDTTGGAEQSAPFVVSFTGAAIALRIRCVCGQSTVIIQTELPTSARVFLKSWLRGKQPSLDDVSIRCPACVGMP